MEDLVGATTDREQFATAGGVWSECQPDRVSQTFVKRICKVVDEGPGISVEAENAVVTRRSNQQVVSSIDHFLVGGDLDKLQVERGRQPGAGIHKHVDKRTGDAVVAEDLSGCLTGNEEIPIGAELQASWIVQTATSAGHEEPDEVTA